MIIKTAGELEETLRPPQSRFVRRMRRRQHRYQMRQDTFCSNLMELLASSRSILLALNRISLDEEEKERRDRFAKAITSMEKNLEDEDDARAIRESL